MCTLRAVLRLPSGRSSSAGDDSLTKRQVRGTALWIAPAFASPECPSSVSNSRNKQKEKHDQLRLLNTSGINASAGLLLVTLWWSPHALEPILFPASCCCENDRAYHGSLAESGKCWNPGRPALTVRLQYGTPDHDTGAEGILSIRFSVSLSCCCGRSSSRA